MRTNIFAILLLITLVNSTKKVTNFEDIVHSFAQLKSEQSPINENLAKLNEISESFADANKELIELKDLTEANCLKVESESKSFIESANKKIAAFQDEVKSINDQVGEIQKNIEKNILDQKEEVKKIEDAREKIKTAKTDIGKREDEITETVNVLHRLYNLAQDELSGKYKIQSQLKNYTVVSENGVSFIQKTNLKQELKSIMKKTETSGKSLISTLILMASNDDGHYSDPKAVQRILDVLDKIIKKNEDKKKEIQGDYEEQTKDYREIITNSANLVENLKETAIKDEFNVSLNHKTIAMYNTDILYMQKVLQRRNSKVTFNQSICKKQNDLVNANIKRYETSKKRINDIKNEIA